MTKQFVSRKIEEQRKEAEQRSQEIGQKIEAERKGKKTKTRIVLGIIAVVVLLVIVYGAVYYFSPGRYDGFAKCLAGKGVIVYGAEWCQYTNAQKGMFGKSFKYLDYRIYDEDPTIKITPTWVINGLKYENVQSFERLSEMTGCSIE